MKDFCGSVLWDSDLTWNTDDPEFTECFFLTILIWVPCVFLFIFTPLELYYIKLSKYQNIPWSFWNISKLCVTFLLIAICCINLGMAIDLLEYKKLYPVHFVAPITQILTFIMSGVLLMLHKKNGIRSSGLLFLFWLFLMLFAIPQYRNEIRSYSARGGINNWDDLEDSSWEDFRFVSYMVYFPLVVVNLILHCFADKAPLGAHYKKSKNASPELSAGFPRKLFFQWFDPMTWKGYRKPLNTSDMWDINPDDESKALVPSFDKYWHQSVSKNKRKEDKSVKPKKGTNSYKVNSDILTSQTNGSILPAMTKAFGGPFWFAGILKLITDLLSFASPQLLGLLISYTESDDPLWKGLLYTFGFFLVAVLTSLINGQYFYDTFLVGFRIRSALISAIYRKALRVSTSSKKDTTVGEIVNLMAVDAHRFFELVSYLHLLWSAPLTIALAIYFLWDLLGPAVLAGVAVMILMVPINVFIATKMRSLQILQMKKKDERVKMMNEILNGIRVLKLYAWEPSFESNIKKVREEEVTILKLTAYLSAGTFFAWTLTPFLVALASFATFVLTDENNILTPRKAFMSLALLNILRGPMAMFPMILSLAMQAWVSITRINKFMNSKELNPNNTTHFPNDNALLIENGIFTWGEEEITLKNINIKVGKSALVAVVGTVGSGKSSLVSALLGEMEKKQGQVNTDGTIAYVPQQAWIQNATLQDNILFGKPMEKTFYESVLEACALKADIEMLPGGDQTEIGEKGINLSGGQKQRVSLARAVYNNADIYFLDDPLSAVDSHVGKHIFDNVIGPNGILAGKTRLLVTHGISFLPHMDNILVMSNGEINESGSYKVLLSQKGAFADFLVQHLNEFEGDDQELLEIKQVLIDKPEGKSILERAESIRSTSSGGSVRGKQNGIRNSVRSHQSTITEVKPTKNMATLIEKEESATGSVNLKVYIQYFKDIGLGMTAIMLVMNLINQGFSVYSNIWLATWANDNNSGDPAVRDRYLGVYGGLGGGQAITLLIASVILAIGCLNAARTLHNKLLSHSLRLPMSFFDTTPLGRIMNRFSKDIDMVDNTLPMSVRTWILMFFTVISVFVVISIASPIFMTVIVPLGIIYYFVQKFYVATSRQLKRIESVTRSPIYSHFGETLTGQSTIRAYNKQQNFTEQSEEKVDFNQMCSYPSIIANRWLGVRLELVGSLVILFAALFAVLGRETMDPALVGLSVSYALQITQVLNFFVRMTAEVETNIVAIERLEEYATLPQEAAWRRGEIDPLWPKEGKVAFQDFQVRYRDGLDLVLRGISFSVNGSEKVGIVGRTGAGKSSLTLALFRIIEAAGGKIVIDNKDISQLGLHNLRSRLTIIPQDPVLFSGTLRMNIDPFDAYTDDDIWRVLEHSHLKSFVKTLSTGLLHEIAEGGDNLSVGQRQLICLARALLRKTKVLILDEATAAVDLETDDLIQKTIRTEFSDCTILTIAHRLNTILDSDKVIVLDKGQIAEFDTPQNLLNDKNSIFYGMAKNSGLVS